MARYPDTPFKQAKLPQTIRSKPRARPVPSIFDPPYTVIAFNDEWRKHVFGAIMLLLRPEFWTDDIADFDERNTAVQEIMALMAQDLDLCAEIENCLPASQTIIDIQTILNSLQSQIAANDNDIAALHAVDTALQDAITANANNISNLLADVNQIQTIDLPQIELFRQDYEARITALENASGGSGGGGSYPTKVVRIEETIDYHVTPVGTEEVWIEIDIPTGYDELRIDLWIQSSTVGFRRLLMFMNDDLDAVNYSSDTGGTEWHNQPYVAQWNHDTLVDNFYAGEIKIKSPDKNYKQGVVASGSYSRDIHADIALSQWSYLHEIAGAVTKLRFQLNDGNINEGSIIRVVGYKEQEVLVPSVNQNLLVTFDTGGDAYELPAQNVGVLGTGGNPDNCIRKSNMQTNEGIYVKIPISGNVTDVEFDIYTNLGWSLLYTWIDDVQEGSYIISPPANAWTTIKLSEITPDFGNNVPYAPNSNIWIALSANQIVADCRIDNVKIILG